MRVSYIEVDPVRPAKNLRSSRQKEININDNDKLGCSGAVSYLALRGLGYVH